MTDLDQTFTTTTQGKTSKASDDDSVSSQSLDDESCGELPTGEIHRQGAMTKRGKGGSLKFGKNDTKNDQNKEMLNRPK